MIQDPETGHYWGTDAEYDWLEFYNSLPPDFQAEALRQVQAMADAQRRFGATGYVNRN